MLIKTETNIIVIIKLVDTYKLYTNKQNINTMKANKTDNAIINSISRIQSPIFSPKQKAMK